MDRQIKNSDSCPFLSKPLTGCRVQELNGQTIPNILEFCGARHPECPLYLHIKSVAPARMLNIEAKETVPDK